MLLNYLHEITLYSRLEKSRSQSFAIVSIDVNRLKQINDNEKLGGHSAGDKLLVNSSEIVRNSFRPDDIITRKGGDEFAVIMPLNIESLKAEYDRYLSNVDSSEETPLSLEGYMEFIVTKQITDNLKLFNQVHKHEDNFIPVSFSWGTAISSPNIRPPYHDLQATFDRADKKMYDHKNSTREPIDVPII
jgi:GGDEF domain-containing protein